MTAAFWIRLIQVPFQVLSVGQNVNEGDIIWTIPIWCGQCETSISTTRRRGMPECRHRSSGHGQHRRGQVHCGQEVNAATMKLWDFPKREFWDSGKRSLHLFVFVVRQSATPVRSDARALTASQIAMWSREPFWLGHDSSSSI